MWERKRVLEWTGGRIWGSNPGGCWWVKGGDLSDLPSELINRPASTSPPACVRVRINTRPKPALLTNISITILLTSILILFSLLCFSDCDLQTMPPSKASWTPSGCIQACRRPAVSQIPWPRSPCSTLTRTGTSCSRTIPAWACSPAPADRSVGDHLETSVWRKAQC